MLSDRVQRIGMSPTLKISGKAKQMKAEGLDVIDLSVGEPDFPTPLNVKTAGKNAIDENFTNYTANAGIPDLKNAIIRKLKEDNGLDYEPNQILVSSGAKHSLYNLCMAVISKGDEAIIPAPYWVSYPPMIELAGGTPVIARTKEENDFRLTPSELTAAISPSTKVLFVNNPSNPTGSAYTREQLEELMEIAMEENLIIIADEIYEKLVYDGFRFISVAALSKKVKEHTVVINGVSKAYAMTGWRIGYAAGPPEIIANMSKVQSHSTSNACSISQKAALEALNGPQTEISRMQAEFQKRRDFMLYKLRSIPGVSCTQPQGAFYLFPNLSSYYNKQFQGMEIRNSYGMAYYLLKYAHVALVPGEAFGDDTFIRLSYATSMENIEKAMERIISAVGKLEPTRKAKAISLNNWKTLRKDFVETERNVSIEVRDALVAESENFLSYDNYYEWNANINGVIIQLRTNHQHLYDYFIENFYPAQIEADLEPHGIIYAVGWIPGREPRAYYNTDSRTAFLFKSALYGQIRSLALGTVIDISERLYDTHSVRGFCLDYDGHGMIIMAPEGTGKSKFLAGLLRTNGVKLVSTDIVFVRFAGGTPVADTPERKFYFRTDFVKQYPDFIPLFERSKCENVVTTKDECECDACRKGESCDIDRGVPYNFAGSKRSYAMLDPYWIGGPEKHIKRTNVKKIVLLRNDAAAPFDERLNKESAMMALEDAANSTGFRSHPFLNQHILVRNS
ncbi:MAG: aminotransferase class I/II-fold pyridoxal phosphate-dependent enzyme, partial [candidate division Zixibacteria bacterium]|nr:aminotransferase class I/II-fold pyridoxal phosphate-dependent enzyme [candidate division Zixibacteria bacterium]